MGFCVVDVVVRYFDGDVFCVVDVDYFVWVFVGEDFGCGWFVEFWLYVLWCGWDVVD